MEQVGGDSWRYQWRAIGPDDESARVRHGCNRLLSGNPRDRIGDLLIDLVNGADPDAEPDAYGSGAVVEDVEARVAAVLGKPAAALFPSGVMAQQAALRSWSDAGHGNRVAMHPGVHLLLHEDSALEALSGLEPAIMGDPSTGLDLASLHAADAAGTLPGIVHLELPTRETGWLPPLDELEAIGTFCHERGVALHLDGARIWEAAAGYGAPVEQVASVGTLGSSRAEDNRAAPTPASRLPRETSSSVYVSFYKALGAFSGAALAGPPELVDQARVWRKRMGGTLYGLWPFAVAAARALDQRLPLVRVWHEHAAGIARAVAAEDGMRIDSPIVTTLLTITFPVGPERLGPVVLATAEATGVWFGGYTKAGPTADSASIEISCYANTAAFTVEEVMHLLRQVRDSVLPSA